MILHEDARAAIRRLDDYSVALVVTSPPYNVGVDYPGHDDAMPWDDYWQMIADVLGPLLNEKLIVGGRLAVNWPSYAVSKRPGYSHHHRFAEMCRAWGAPLLAEITWHQGSSDGKPCQWGSFKMASAPRFSAASEVIQVWCRETTTRPDAARETGITNEQFIEWTKCLWRFSGRPGIRSYPATFPPELPERLILLLTLPGDLVADPFCGTGTTLEAAKRLGRRWWGCDVSERAIEIARRRLSDCDSLFAPDCLCRPDAEPELT